MVGYLLVLQIPSFAALMHVAVPEIADFATIARAARCSSPACAATLEGNPFSVTNPGSLTRDERMRSRYGGFRFEPEGGWDESELFSYDELASTMR